MAGRMIFVAMLCAALAACAPQAPNYYESPEWQEAMRQAQERTRQRQAEERARAEAAERALTPAQRARRDLDGAKRTRENELLERALTSSPDYTAAVRRAAVANVDGEAAVLALDAPRRPAPNPRTREAAIVAEEARLSDAVEVRRRQRLAEQAQQRQREQVQAAEAACIAHGQQVEASMYNPRSLLNLEAAVTGAQARQNCLANIRR